MAGPEASIEKYLLKRAKAAGLLVRKVQWVGHNHAPDRIVMSPGLTVWVELKAPGKTAAPGQAREHARMIAHGQNVIVIDSREGVDELIKRMLSHD